MSAQPKAPKTTERSHFTMIPNIVDDMALTYCAVRLYLHIRRVAGEGSTCWQSTTTLAKHCGMARSEVSRSKKELVAAGLITIAKVDKGRGQFPSDEIRVVDVWDQNLDRFSGKTAEGVAETTPVGDRPSRRPVEQAEAGDRSSQATVEQAEGADRSSQATVTGGSRSPEGTVTVPRTAPKKNPEEEPQQSAKAPSEPTSDEQEHDISMGGGVPVALESPRESSSPKLDLLNARLVGLQHVVAGLEGIQASLRSDTAPGCEARWTAVIKKKQDRQAELRTLEKEIAEELKREMMAADERWRRSPVKQGELGLVVPAVPLRRQQGGVA